MGHIRRLEEMHIGYPIVAVFDALCEVFRKDRKYRAAMGFGVMIPGVLFQDYKVIVQTKAYAIIPGTSDARRGEEEDILNDRAFRYCRLFNLVTSVLRRPKLDRENR